MDYLAKEKKCLRNSQGKKITAQMYGAREIIQEDGEKEGQEDLFEENEENEENNEGNDEDEMLPLLTTPPYMCCAD